MKSPPSILDDGDDIFGPPRTYATGYCAPKNRPSMISAKYRQKEERRKVLKISINKLKKIEDPEASLCRSVLINNTVKRLQKEARDEKIQKQQLNYPKCYDNDNFLNIKSEFMKNELKTFDDVSSSPAQLAGARNGAAGCCGGNGNDDDNGRGAVVDDFDKMSAMMEISESVKSVLEDDSDDCRISNGGGNNNNNNHKEQRSPFDDIEDCDVQDVLAQFYMPPTPRMLTTIDDDEDVNVVDDEPAPKRPKLDLLVDSTNRINQQVLQIPFGISSSNNNNNNSLEGERLRLFNESLDATSSSTTTTTSPFTCGQASMFSEMQSNVYHSLIASLET